jgi:hypothetical protein
MDQTRIFTNVAIFSVKNWEKTAIQHPSFKEKKETGEQRV